MHRRQRVSIPSTEYRQTAQRSASNTNLLLTAGSIGVVVLLVLVTFIADWMRAPTVSATTAFPLLSPNNDQIFDTATITYNLSDDSGVQAQVLDQFGNVARNLLNERQQPAGQHTVTWDGLDDFGRVVQDGSYRLQVTAKGSLRSVTQNVAIQVDTLPPALQLANLNDGMRVGNPLLLISGVTEAGAALSINGLPQAGVVDSQGRFSFQYKLAATDNALQIRAADTAGNTASVNRTVFVVTEPPKVVINTPADGEWLNQTLVAVTGQAPAGTTLTVNGQAVQVGQNGTFNYQLLLQDGDNILRVEAVDDVGNIAKFERLVHIKSRGPALRVDVGEGQGISESTFLLTGHTDPGASITINQNVVPVSAQGDFQTSLNLLGGTNLITVEARDQAGNLTAVSRQVNYTGPLETSPISRLWRNWNTLPLLTIPAVIALSLLIGFWLYRKNQVSLLLSVDRDSLEAGTPGSGRTLMLQLDLNRQARVTLEVLDSRGYAVATLINDRRKMGRRHLIPWDACDDFGRPVLAGEYTVHASAGVPPLHASSAIQIRVEDSPYTFRRGSEREAASQRSQRTNRP